MIIIAQSADTELQQRSVMDWALAQWQDVLVITPEQTWTLPVFRRALKHLRGEGVVLVLNAEQSSEWRLSAAGIRKEWHPMLGTLVRLAASPVMPVFVRPASHGGRCTVLPGRMLPARRLQKVEDDRALTEFIRSRVLLERVESTRATTEPSSASPILLPVTGPRPAALLHREVQMLQDSGQCLTSQNSLSVFIARAAQAPNLLHEIGRQRELSFREAGEGTGREIDLDRFDQHYLHLFLWDAERARVAGAYRLGCADEILRDQGPSGLYTRSLFRFGKKFLSQLHDAVELGRSFIAADYQRDAVAMPLLWKGIVAWLAENPRYRKLFGPVSISKDYAPESKRLMVRYLRKHHTETALSRHVQPRRPYFGLGISPAEKSFLRCAAVDAEDCSEVVSGFEADGKGFPTLLRHYLKLNGRFLSFNVDPDFSDVLDGLVMVDMLQTDPRLPARLMGREKWQRYLAHHQPQPKPTTLRWPWGR